MAVQIPGSCSKSAMALRSGKLLNKTKNKTNEVAEVHVGLEIISSNEPTMHDVTEEYNQLVFENERLKTDVSLLENEADQTLNELNVTLKGLQLENNKLKEKLGCYESIRMKNINLEAQIIILNQKIEEDESLKNELIENLTTLREEIASKNEIINLLREQREELEPEAQVTRPIFLVPKNPAKHQTRSYKPGPSWANQNRFQALASGTSLENANEEDKQANAVMGLNNFPPLNCGPRVPNSGPNTLPKSKHNGQPIIKTSVNHLKLKPTPDPIRSQRRVSNFQKRSSMLLLADSHGRFLYDDIKEVKLQRARDFTLDLETQCILKPNAGLQSVVEGLPNLTKKFSKSDVVVVLGGTNNRLLGEEDNIVQIFKSALSNTKHTNVIIVGIPVQHTRPQVSDSVDYINFEIQHLAERTPHAWFLPANELPRHMFTRQGIHFNRKGKKIISRMLLDLAVKAIDSGSGIKEIANQRAVTHCEDSSPAELVAVLPQITTNSRAKEPMTHSKDIEGSTSASPPVVTLTPASDDLVESPTPVA